MTTGARPAPARPSPLVTRVLSGVLIAAAALALILAGTWGLWTIAVLVCGLGLWEFRHLSDLMGFKAPSWLLLPLGLYFTFSGTVLKAVPAQLVLSIALIAGLSAFLVLPGRREGLGRWALGLAGAIYLGVPLNYYLLLYGKGGFKDVAWVLLVIVSAVVSDVAAYLVGRAVGKHPFFPAISPKKTVEGAVAGVLCCVPVMLAGGWWLLGVPPWHGAVLGLLVGVSAEAGDLVESQMKRIAGVKDSSNLIPGHGGVLDRVDSLLFAPIAVTLYAGFFHLLPA